MLEDVAYHHNVQVVEMQLVDQATTVYTTVELSRNDNRYTRTSHQFAEIPLYHSDRPLWGSYEGVSKSEVHSLYTRFSCLTGSPFAFFGV